MSYLLINFWYTRIQANKAALKAMIVNRVGDICFIGFVGLYVSLFGGVDFELYVVQSLFVNDEVGLFCFGSILILLAAIGKSAQLGLHT